MYGVLTSFEDLYDKVLTEHNEKTRQITQVCFDLHKVFHEQMSHVSTIYNDTSNSMKNILQELTIAQKLQTFDTCVATEIKTSVEKLTEIVKTYRDQNKEFSLKVIDAQEDIQDEQNRLEKDKPKFDFLKKIGMKDLPENNSIGSSIGQFFLGAIAFAVDGIFQLIHCDKHRKYEGLSRVSDDLANKSEDLLKLFYDFHLSLDKTITNLDNYTILVDKLLKYSPQGNSSRLLLMTTDMIPETEALENDFQGFKSTNVTKRRRVVKDSYSCKLSWFN